MTPIPNGLLLAGYAEKYHACMVVLAESGGTTSTGGVRFQGVGRFLQGGGAGDSILLVVYVGPFGINGKEGIGDTHGVPATDHGE